MIFLVFQYLLSRQSPFSFLVLSDAKHKREFTCYVGYVSLQFYWNCSSCYCRERVTGWRYLNFGHRDFWITQMFLALLSNSFSLLTYSLGVGYQQYWGCWWTCLQVHFKLSFGLLFLLTRIKSNFMKARRYLQYSRFSVSCQKESGSSEGTLCQVKFAKYTVCIRGSPEIFPTRTCLLKQLG